MHLLVFEKFVFHVSSQLRHSRVSLQIFQSCFNQTEKCRCFINNRHEFLFFHRLNFTVFHFNHNNSSFHTRGIRCTHMLSFSFFLFVILSNAINQRKIIIKFIHDIYMDMYVYVCIYVCFSWIDVIIFIQIQFSASSTLSRFYVFYTKIYVHLYAALHVYLYTALQSILMSILFIYFVHYIIF